MARKGKIILFTLAFVLASSNVVSAAPQLFELNVEVKTNPVVFDMDDVTDPNKVALRNHFKDALSYTHGTYGLNMYISDDENKEHWLDFSLVRGATCYLDVVDKTGTYANFPSANNLITATEKASIDANGNLQFENFNGWDIGTDSDEEVKSVNVVDKDGDAVGRQRLVASAILADDTVANNGVTYKWYHEGSDTVLGTVNSYAVTRSDIGKTICVEVTVDGKGSNIWKASNTVSGEQ